MAQSNFCIAATKFAGLVGLPYAVIKKYIAQGRIPYIRDGKCHTMIPVDKGKAAIERIAEENAKVNVENHTGWTPPSLVLPPMAMPTPGIKRKGRTPDKVKRMAMLAVKEGE